MALVICAGVSSAERSSAETEMLYATKVPTGSSFVRVATGSASPVKVAIGSSPAVPLDPSATIVTNYHLASGNNALTISIDGKATTPVMVPANRFITLIYRPGFDGPSFTSVTDEPGDDNGLRVELRFYNLVDRCTGSLALQNGQAVFDRVAAGQSRSRSVNPVAATLFPKCGANVGDAFKLPRLKPQSQYSLFLVGVNSKPIVVGNMDATEDR
jgi:alginate O-acetyltransferase complex protein AlgF